MPFTKVFNRPGMLGAAALLAGAMLATSPAQASTSTASMAVSATVPSTCSISANALAFGNYSSAQTDGSTTLSVTCANSTTYTVALDAGTGTGATVTTRKMTSGAQTLNYSLYTDSARSSVWGTTTGTNTVAGTGTGSAQSLTVYGRIPGSQTPQPGSYTDTITATITY